MKTRPRATRACGVSAIGLGCNNFGRRLDPRPAPVVHAALEPASRCSTPRTSTASTGRRRCSAKALGAAARSGDRDQVRRPMDGANGRLGALAPLHLDARSRRACGGSAPTRSTSTSCTVPTRSRRSTRRCARSTTGAPGQGALHRLLELRRLAGGRRRLDGARRRLARGSSARRTSTACSSASIEHELVPGAASTSASASCRSSRSRAACSPASTSAANRRRRARASAIAALAARPDRRELRQGRAARRIRASARPQAARLAFGWLAAQPAVASVIAGATKPEQVEQNVAGAGWVLVRGPGRARRITGRA